MSKIIGTVDFVKRDNKALKLEGGDIWYSSWAAFEGISKGQEVEMDVVQKPGSGGHVFYNIQPNTLRVTGGTAVAMPEATPGNPTVTTVRAGWPIPKDSARDRCIMRQNAVGNAIKYHEATGGTRGVTLSLDEMDIIATARIFESYYSGDLDQAELEVGLEKMQAV